MGLSALGGAGGGGGKRFQTLRSNPPLPTVFRQLTGSSGLANATGARTGPTITIPADVATGDEVFVHLYQSNHSTVQPGVSTPAGWEQIGGAPSSANSNNTNTFVGAAFRTTVGQVAAASSHTFSLTSTVDWAYVVTILRPPPGIQAVANRTAAFNNGVGGGNATIFYTTPTGAATVSQNSTTTSFGSTSQVGTSYRGLHLLVAGLGALPANGVLTAAHLTTVADPIYVRSPNNIGVHGTDRYSDPIAQATAAAGSPNGNSAGAIAAMSVAVVQSDNLTGFVHAGPSFKVPSLTYNGGLSISANSHISIIPGIDARISITPSQYNKSPWQQVFASTQFSSTDLLIELQPRSVQASSTTSTVLLDIATGATGSEQVIAADISASDVALATYVPNGPIRIALPLRLPAGSRVSIRGYLETSASVPPYTVNATLIG